MFKKSLIVLFLVMAVAGFSMSSVCANNDGIIGNRIPTKLTLNPINNVILKDTVNISGHLNKDVIGVKNGIVNQPILITVQHSANKIIFRTSTDHNGVFSLAYTPLNTGLYNIVAEFRGNNQYRGSEDNGRFNVDKFII
jgi:hypothetical protein